MKHHVLIWLFVMALCILASMADVHAEGDVIKPPPGTIPQEPKPIRVYCPIMFGSDTEGWIWPASR